MTQSLVQLVFVLLTVVLSAAASMAAPPGREVDVYHIGNSLTRNLSVERLRALFESAGGSYDHGTQLGGAKKLYQHLAKKLADGRSFKINNIQTKPYGDYDKALQEYTFDAVVLQPYGWWLNDRLPDNEIEKGDLQAAAGFMQYASGRNPSGNVAAERFYIYGTWPNLKGIMQRAGIDADGDGRNSFAEFWSARYSTEVPTAGWTTPNRDFLEQLVKGLNEKFPGLKHPVRLVPVGDVFAALDEKIRNGDLPGIEDYFTRTNPITVAGRKRPSNVAYYRTSRVEAWTKKTPFEKIGPDYTGFDRELGIQNVYADSVHMNDQPHNGDDDGTLGGYIASLTFYAVFTGRSPVGLTSEPWERLDPDKDAALIGAVQKTVWEVVAKDPLAGVGTGTRTGAAKAPEMTEISPGKDPALLEQPAKIPGNWQLTEQPLPPLDRIINSDPTRRPVCGLYCWASEYIKYHNFIGEVGFTNFRLSGPFNDRCMKLYVQDDMEVMATLTTRLHQSFTNKKSDWRNRGDYDSDEAFIEDYLAGVDKFLSRWGPGGTFFDDHPDVPERPIRFVEIWNEPNFWYLDMKTYDRPKNARERIARETRREKLYAKLLPAAYDHIKQKWPSVKVVGFGAGGSAHADVRFIRDVHKYNPAVADSYDILSTHPYVRPAPPEADNVRAWGQYSIAKSLAEIREIMQEYGTVGRPVWYTELNWSITAAEGGTYGKGKPGRRATTAKLQGAYWVRSYAMALRLGVERVTFMSVVDTDGVNAGLINRDGTWRPSAHAVQTMIDVMPHPNLLGAVSDGKDGCYAYWFQDDAGKGDEADSVLMAWNVTGPRTLELEWPAQTARVTDMAGSSTTVEAKGGKLELPVGPCPIYVESPPVQ